MEKPAQSQHQTHVLFDFSPLESRDHELDDKTQRCYQNLKQMIANRTAKECHEIYLKHLSMNAPQNTDDLIMGLLVAILVEDGQQGKYYRDIVAISKDGLNLFSAHLNYIVGERVGKLRDNSLKQVFWITHQLMKASISIAENICSNLVRQAAGGDLSAKNLWLVENVLELLIENRSWLVNSTSHLVPMIIYTFLRLISDHMAPAHSALRQKEVDFVIGLIREKFLDCMQIGRDFLRLLYHVLKISEFEKLWHDIHNNPKLLHSTFQGPLQLLATRTTRRLIQSRLTVDMEKKISFLATQVKFGNQKRYQDWFHKQYLSTPESLSLRCDLIRYICTIIHPSNEVLCSEIIPRWAIIGWLLTTCTTSASAANSKLALFFDWLLYDTKMDNIMNIEPAILVMYYSIRSHPAVTAGLLDFLCRMPANFSPKLSEHFKAGIKRSLQQILEKKVVASLVPLFANPKHDPTLKALIRDNYPEFCADTGQVDNGTSPINPTIIPARANHPPTITAPNHVNVNQNKLTEVILIEQDKSSPAPDATTTSSETVGNRVVPNHDTNHITTRPNDQPVTTVSIDDRPAPISSPSSSSKDETKAFSWNGTENANASYSHKQQNHDNKNRKSSVNSGSSDTTKKSKVENITNDNSNNSTAKNLSLPSSDPSEYIDLARDDTSTVKVIYPFMTVPDLDFKESINSFDEPIRCILEDLSVERCNETRCNLMEKLISTVFESSEQNCINSSTIKDLGHCIAYLVVDDFSTRIFPSSSQNNESLEESLASPFFILCRSAFLNNRPTWTLRPMSLLVAIAKFLESTGFLILYFLRVNAIADGLNVANNYIDFCNSAKRKLSKCLYEDLFMALTYDSEMFCFLLPSIFGEVASSGSFPVTGNIDLVHLVVSSIDPINLQELICLCLTSTVKVLNKEEVMPLIETSLNWESWEQYCVWKLVSAQNVPVENYLPILSKLNTKANAEAMSCILLNLQKVSEPTSNMIQQIMSCEFKPNDPFISSILRYWSMKTDVKELAKLISSLVESRPSSPQVKRKGQAKATTKNPTALSSRSEKILCHLDSIRQRAPRNKLLAQAEILEMLSHMETLSNDNQKKRFADLFSNRPKPNKKQKKSEKEVTS